MAYVVRKGVPEILELWKRLLKEFRAGTIRKEDRELFKKWSKAIRFLREDPTHPGLNTHDISDLTRRYGRKVFQSYLENNTPSVGRMYWVFGPEDGQITVIGMEPYPEDREYRAYNRVRLSTLPPPDPPIGTKNRGPRGKR